MNSVSALIISQTFLFLLIDNALAGCLPSKSSACTVCDYSTYTTDTENDLLNPCQAQKTSFYSKFLWIPHLEFVVLLVMDQFSPLSQI